MEDDLNNEDRVESRNGLNRTATPDGHLDVTAHQYTVYVNTYQEGHYSNLKAAAQSAIALCRGKGYDGYVQDSRGVRWTKKELHEYLAAANRGAATE